MMIELTLCNGRKLLVNPRYLQTIYEITNGHCSLEIEGYGHAVEVTQSMETIKKLLNNENT